MTSAVGSQTVEHNAAGKLAIGQEGVLLLGYEEGIEQRMASAVIQTDRARRPLSDALRRGRRLVRRRLLGDSVVDDLTVGIGWTFGGPLVVPRLSI